MSEELEFYKSKFDGTTIDKRLGMIGDSYSELLKNLGLQYITNPNLLDNWYFVRPVNQRGQTEYTAVGYTVDRWRITDGVAATLQGGALNISYTVAGWNLTTFLDNVLIPGATYTLSCLYKATVVPIRLVCSWGAGKYFFNEQAPISDDWALAEITGTIPTDASIDANQIVIQSLNTGSGSFSIKAVKLELGDTQTLAHKENGVWVLNEVPDYGEQLRRCQRHAFSPLYEAYATAVICNLFVSSVANGVAFGEVTLPVSMRNKPVFSGNASKFWIVAENGGGASHPTAIAVMGLSADKVMIQVNGSYTANTQYILYVENPFTSADFLLSADL